MPCILDPFPHTQNHSVASSSSREKPQQIVPLQQVTPRLWYVHLVMNLDLVELSADSRQTPPPPPPHEQSRWRRFLQTVGRVTLVTVVVSGGAFYYLTQRGRYPGPQLPHDPSKKTLVVLGSGWGSTSFLQSLDTEDFNVVRTAKHVRIHHLTLPSGGHQSEELLLVHAAVA